MGGIFESIENVLDKNLAQFLELNPEKFLEVSNLRRSGYSIPEILKCLKCETIDGHLVLKGKEQK